MIKFISSEFVIWQIFVLRSLLIVPVLLIALKIHAPDAFGLPKVIGWTIVRSLLLVSMWIAYYLALPKLEFSVAAAAYYTLPIFITLFSAMLIGERISLLGWYAVFIGFFGVLLMLQPRTTDFNLYGI